MILGSFPNHRILTFVVDKIGKVVAMKVKSDQAREASRAVPSGYRAHESHFLAVVDVVIATARG